MEFIRDTCSAAGSNIRADNVKQLLEFLELQVEFEAQFNLTASPEQGFYSLKVTSPELDNVLLLDFYLKSSSIGIEDIKVARKGSKLGQAIIEALQEYAGENDLDLFAEDVHNYGFFAKQGFEPSVSDPDNPYGYRSQWVWTGCEPSFIQILDHSIA
jgi:hypothetical protein